jgi:hypothetical protein
MSKIVKASDLAKQEGDPTDRAVLGRVLEKVKVRGSVFGNAVEVDGELIPDGSQSTTVTMLMFAVAFCLVAGAAHLVGASAMTALILGLCVPPGAFAYIRIITRLTR